VTRKPRTQDEWSAERQRLIAMIKALLRDESNARQTAQDWLVEVFEDEP